MTDEWFFDRWRVGLPGIGWGEASAYGAAMELWRGLNVAEPPIIEELGFRRGCLVPRDRSGK